MIIAVKKKTYLRIGLAIVLIVLTIFNYKRYTDLDLDAGKVVVYERFNDRLLKVKSLTLIDSSADIGDKVLGEYFKDLQLKGKVTYVERLDSRFVVYKIKHEKVRPIHGPG